MSVGVKQSQETPVGGQTTKLRVTWRQRLRRRVPLLLTILNLTVFFSAWEMIVRAGYVSELFFPRPSTIWTWLITAWQEGVLQPELAISLRNFVIGMSLASLVGIPLGLIMGVSKIVDSVFSPYVWGLASVPRVAIVPLLILILGFSNATNITLIFLAAVFPIVINCMAGPKTVDGSLIRAGQVFGAGKLDILRKVILPFTLPFIISGLNQGLTRGLVGLVIGEMFAGNKGLGYLIIRGGQIYKSEMIYGTLLILVVISLSFVHGVRWIERKVAPWRQSTGV